MTTEPRWLDDREQHTWRAFVEMRHALDSGIDRQLSQDAGMSGADYQLLVPLSEAPGCRLRARDLGRAVGWDRSRLSHQVRRMESRGLVSKESCPTDARGTFVRLTPAGLEAMRTAAAGHVAWVREHFFDLLTDSEVDSLAAASVKVLDRLRADRDNGSPDGACS